MDEAHVVDYNCDDEEITQDDAWTVIGAYFKDNGLVRQQIESFDEFIGNTIQDIVNDSGEIEVRYRAQHNPGHRLDFAEVYSRVLSTRLLVLLLGLS